MYSYFIVYGIMVFCLVIAYLDSKLLLKLNFDQIKTQVRDCIISNIVEQKEMSYHIKTAFPHRQLPYLYGRLANLHLYESAYRHLFCYGLTSLVTVVTLIYNHLEKLDFILLVVYFMFFGFIINSTKVEGMDRLEEVDMSDTRTYKASGYIFSVLLCEISTSLKTALTLSTIHLFMMGYMLVQVFVL